MQVVVLTGPESAGKSSLCQALAQEFNAPVVGEYVRQFINQQARTTCYADISYIAQQQLQAELAQRAQQPQLLLLDTHLLSNKLWSELLFNNCPEWIEPALKAQQYDLICLLSPDGLPWQADGQRCQPDLIERQGFYQQLQYWLTRNQQPLLYVSGTWQQRFIEIKRAINQLLNQP